MSVRQYNIVQLEGFYLTAADPTRIEVGELANPKYREILKRYKKVVKTYKYASDEEIHTHHDKEKDVGEVKVERHDAIYLLAIDLKVALIDAWSKGQRKLQSDRQQKHREMVAGLKDGSVTPEQFQDFIRGPRDKRVDMERLMAGY